MRYEGFLSFILFGGLLAILISFEFFYLFGFAGETCYPFCMTFRDVPCSIFSALMFLLGLTSLVAWLPRYTWLTSAFLSVYFAVTFLASLCWARWVPLLSLMAILASVLFLGLSEWRAPAFKEAAEMLSFGLAFSAFVFLAGWGVLFCLGSSSKLLSCALVALGLLSVPFRMKHPRYSSLPLLAYFTLGSLTTGFNWLELLGVLASLMAFSIR